MRELFSEQVKKKRNIILISLVTFFVLFAVSVAFKIEFLAGIVGITGVVYPIWLWLYTISFLRTKKSLFFRCLFEEFQEGS